MSALGRLTAPALAGAALLSLGGCAGGRVYEHGINHVYLCTVRVVRAYGYQVRQQDFRESKGKLVAAMSTPDPLNTEIKRGFFGKAGQVIGNILEHGKVEFFDDYVAGRRVRTDRRVVARFKASGFLGWRSKKRTKVKLRMDITDYGREEWVIAREGVSKDAGRELHASLRECLVTPRWAGPRSPPAEAHRAPAAGVAAAKRAPAAAGPEAAETPPRPEEPAEEPPTTPAEPAPLPRALSPEELEAIAAKGREAYEAGDFKKTIELLGQVTDADPGNAEALGYLGAACYQTGRLEEAIGMYERYVTIVPSDLRTREFLEKLRQEKSSK